MKRPMLKAVALTAAMTVGSWLYAAPPPNDNIASAQALAGDSGELTADITEATREEAEDYLNYSYSQHTVWYKWKATKDGFASFNTYGSDFDTILCAYIDSGEGALDYVESTSGDWPIEFYATAGQEYLIRVGGYSSEGGNLALAWSLDSVDSAKALSGDFGAQSVDVAFADGEYSKSLWYKWTVQNTGPAYLKLGSQIEDEDFDCYFEIYTNGVWVSYGHGEYPGFCAQAGQTYLIRVGVERWGEDEESANAKAFLAWGRDLADGDFRILAADGVVVASFGDLPKDLKSSDFPAGVTEIARSALEGSDGVKFVAIPAGVKKIGEYAFADSSDLAWVDYDGDVSAIVIADTAFIRTPYCSELPFKLIQVDGVYTNVEWNAEYTVATTNLVPYCRVTGFVGTCPAELEIPEGVTEIASYAFKEAEDLVKVTLPSTLKPGREGLCSVGYCAFAYCDELEEVVGLPASAEVSNYAFRGSLYEKVRPFELVTTDQTTGSYRYDEARGESVWTVTTNVWVTGFHGTCPEEVTIPEGIYGIMSSVFSLDSAYSEYGYRRSLVNLKKLNLPASLRRMSNYAFSYLPYLETVVFVGNKEDVSTDYGVFYGTPYQQNQPFELVTRWLTGSSYYDSKTGNYVSSSNLWVMGHNGGKVPETIVIPDGVYGIYWSAFSDLEGVTAVTIPASVKQIYGNAFSGCTDLATVTFRGNKDDVSIDNSAFSGTAYNAAQPFKLLDYWYTTWGYYNENDEWVSCDEPRINWYVNGYVGTCPAKLDFSQYLSNSVVSVTVNADFSDSDALTELVAPDGVLLNNISFRYCPSLAKVTIGNDYVTNKTWLTENFQGTPWLDTAVPFELVTELVTETNEVEVLVSEASGDCCSAQEEVWTLQTNVVTKKVVTGYYGNVPASLTFPEDIDEIDSSVFYGCDNITEIVVPGNVKEVGYYAFAHCGNLQNVEFEEGVESIGSSMFYGCGDGMQVTLPASAMVGYPDPDDDEKWIGGDTSYSSVFYGIDGDVDVIAPRRMNQIYDRAFYAGSYYSGYYYGSGESHFGRTCVEYYTRVVLDANGGTFEGDAEFRCFDDVLTGLPTPTLAGKVFRGWWDDDDTLYANGYVWGENDAQVYLTAEWAGEKRFTVYGLAGGTEIVLGEGDDYETLKRVLTEMYGENPQPYRHGLKFRYWTVDGVELNHRSVIGENSTFGAFFDEFNPLSDNPEAAIDAAAAQTYDGYLLDYKGNNAGTIQVKVGKPNKKTGEAKVSATVQMFGTKKVTFKAEPKGSWKIETGAATKGVTLFSTKATDKIVIDISEKGIFGTYGTYDIIGSRNTSKKDEAYASWSGKKYDIAFKTKDGTGNAFTRGYSGVTVSIANKGKVKITGVMADGAKVNASAQLLIADNREGCVNVFVPMYTGKKGGFGFVLWIASDGTTATVESISTWTSTDNKAPFTAELECIGAAVPAPASSMTFALEAVSAIEGVTILEEFLPKTVAASLNGTKLTVAKANKIKVDKTGAATRTGETDNDAGLKLTYTTKTGSYKGSFTVYALASGRLKKYRANVNGVFIGGAGYGTAVIKGVGSYPVSFK